MIDLGPENEWRDLECPTCGMVYLDIEPSRAQTLHNQTEICGGTLRERERESR